MSKHTPGPWVGFVDQGTLASIMPAMRSGSICTFMGGPTEPDGQLMIAAPDLLAALRGALVVIESMPRPTEGLVSRNVQAAWDKRVAAIHAAIAKAGG